MNEELTLSHIARILQPSQARLVQLRDLVTANYAGENSDSLYYWDAEISNDLLDSHFTHMSESTLKNYAEDATRGVAFLKGHDWRSLPIGYSIEGLFEGGDAKKRVVASFYTDTAIAEAADLVHRMKSGLLRDVSVGFHGGRAICDLCGQEFWDCRHFPGLKYEEKKGDTVVVQLATFTIEDARLSEVSGVFDGSTPDAMILKAQRHAASGLLTMEQVGLLEARYRVSLPTTRTFAVPKEQEKGKMNEAEILLNEVRSKLAVGEEDSPISAIERMQARIKELEPQAKDGQQYRSDLVSEALAEGVRAQGEEFDAEAYKEILQNAPLTTVKRMKEDWKRVADKFLPGGRSSQDGSGQEDRTNVENRSSFVPDEAYI